MFSKVVILFSLALALLNIVKFTAALPVNYITKNQEDEKIEDLREKTKFLNKNRVLYPEDKIIKSKILKSNVNRSFKTSWGKKWQKKT